MAHGDIKPDNFVITSEGTLALIDFGHTDVITTITSEYHGTKDYNPPEMEEEHSMERADIFQLGVVLFILLFLEVPFVNSGEKKGPLATP